MGVIRRRAEPGRFDVDGHLVTLSLSSLVHHANGGRLSEDVVAGVPRLQWPSRPFPTV